MMLLSDSDDSSAAVVLWLMALSMKVPLTVDGGGIPATLRIRRL